MVSDPYKTLNLPHTADERQIKTSYRQLAKKFHPDTFSQPCFSEEDKQQASTKFAEIYAAYALLTDETRKAEYDRMYKYGAYDDNHNNETTKTTSTCTTTKNTPPPPPSSSPPGGAWMRTMDPKSGRTYYYNNATGQTSWYIPKPPTSIDTRRYHSRANTNSGPYYTRYMSAQEQPPDNHQCTAFCSLLLCPPIGALAVYHSIQVDRCWKQGLRADAINHAQQAPQYSCMGNMVGIAFWLFILWRRNNDGGEFFDDWRRYWDDLEWGNNEP